MGATALAAVAFVLVCGAAVDVHAEFTGATSISVVGRDFSAEAVSASLAVDAVAPIVFRDCTFGDAVTITVPLSRTLPHPEIIVQDCTFTSAKRTATLKVHFEGSSANPRPSPLVVAGVRITRNLWPDPKPRIMVTGATGSNIHIGAAGISVTAMTLPAQGVHFSNFALQTASSFRVADTSHSSVSSGTSIDVHAVSVASGSVSGQIILENNVVERLSTSDPTITGIALRSCAVGGWANSLVLRNNSIRIAVNRRIYRDWTYGRAFGITFDAATRFADGGVGTAGAFVMEPSNRIHATAYYLSHATCMTVSSLSMSAAAYRAVAVLGSPVCTAGQMSAAANDVGTPLRIVGRSSATERFATFAAGMMLSLAGAVVPTDGSDIEIDGWSSESDIGLTSLGLIRSLTVANLHITGNLVIDGAVVTDGLIRVTNVTADSIVFSRSNVTSEGSSLDPVRVDQSVVVGTPGIHIDRCTFAAPPGNPSTSTGSSPQPYSFFLGDPKRSRALTLRNVSTTLVTSSQGIVEGIRVASSTFRSGAFMAMEAVHIDTRTTSRGTANGVHFVDTCVDGVSSAVVFGALNRIAPRAGVHHYIRTTYGTARGVFVSGASSGFGRPASIVFTSPPYGLAPTSISPAASNARNANGVVMDSTSDPVSDTMAAYLLERGRALGFSADLDVTLPRLGNGSQPFVVENVVFVHGAVTFALPFAGNAPSPAACTSAENGVHLVVRNATIRYGLHVTGAGCISNITIVNSTIGGFILTHFAIAGGRTSLTIIDSTFDGEISLQHGAVGGTATSPPATPTTVAAIAVVNTTINVAEGPFDSCFEVKNVSFANSHGRLLIDTMHAETSLKANMVALRFDDVQLSAGATVTVTRSVLRMLPPTFLYSHCLVISGANTRFDAASLFTLSHSTLFARGKQDPWKIGRVYGVTIQAANWWTLLGNRSASTSHSAGTPPRFAVGVALYGNTYDIVGVVPIVAAALTVTPRSPMSVLERLFDDVLLRTQRDSLRPVARGYIVAAADDAPDWAGLSDVALDGGIQLSFDKMDVTFVSTAFSQAKTFTFARLDMTQTIQLDGLGQRRRVVVGQCTKIGGLHLIDAAFVGVDSLLSISASTVIGDAVTLERVSVTNFARVAMTGIYFDEAPGPHMLQLKSCVVEDRASVVVRGCQGSIRNTARRTSASAIQLGTTTVANESSIRFDANNITVADANDDWSTLISLTSSVVVNGSVVAVTRSHVKMEAGRHLYAGWTYGHAAVLAVSGTSQVQQSEVFLGNGSTFVTASHRPEREWFLYVSYGTCLWNSSRIVVEAAAVKRMRTESFPTGTIANTNVTFRRVNFSTAIEVRPAAIEWFTGRAWPVPASGGNAAIEFDCSTLDGRAIDIAFPEIINLTQSGLSLTLPTADAANCSSAFADTSNVCRLHPMCGSAHATAVNFSGPGPAIESAGVASWPVCDCMCDALAHAARDPFRCWPATVLEPLPPTAFAPVRATATRTPVFIPPTTTRTPTSTASKPLPHTLSGTLPMTPSVRETPTGLAAHAAVSSSFAVRSRSLRAVDLPPVVSGSVPRNAASVSQTTRSIGEDALRPRFGASNDDENDADDTAGPLSMTVVAQVIGGSAIAAGLISPVAAARGLRVGSTARVVECILSDDGGDNTDFVPSSGAPSGSSASNDGGDDAIEYPNRVEQPFQAAIGAGKYQVVVGSAAISTAFLLGFALLHLAVVARLSNVSPPEFQKSKLRTVARFVSGVAVAVGVSFWGPVVTAGAVTVLTHPGVPDLHRLVGAAVAAGVGVIFATLVFAVLARYTAYAEAFPTSEGPNELDGRTSSASEPSRDRPFVTQNRSTSMPYVEAFGLLFDATYAPQRTACRAYFVVEVALALLGAVAEGTFTESRGGCITTILVVFTAGVAGVVYLLWVQPFLLAAESGFAIVFACGNVGIAAVALLALSAPSVAPAIGYIVFIMAVGFFVQAVVLAGLSFLSWHRRQPASAAGYKPTTRSNTRDVAADDEQRCEEPLLRLPVAVAASDIQEPDGPLLRSSGRRSSLSSDPRENPLAQR